MLKPNFVESRFKEIKRQLIKHWNNSESNRPISLLFSHLNSTLIPKVANSLELAEILADVYLLLSGGQTAMDLSAAGEKGGEVGSIRRISADREPFKVIRADEDELAAHEKYLDGVAKKCETVIWRS